MYTPPGLKRFKRRLIRRLVPAIGTLFERDHDAVDGQQMVPNQSLSRDFKAFYQRAHVCRTYARRPAFLGWSGYGRFVTLVNAGRRDYQKNPLCTYPPKGVSRGICTGYFVYRLAVCPDPSSAPASPLCTGQAQWQAVLLTGWCVQKAPRPIVAIERGQWDAQRGANLQATSMTENPYPIWCATCRQASELTDFPASWANNFRVALRLTC